MQNPEFHLAQPLALHSAYTRRRRSQPSRCVEKKSATLEQQHEDTEAQRDTGSKRTVQEAEPLEEAPVTKRVCVAGHQQAMSPVADDDIIDVETVSVSSAGDAAITGQVTSDFGLGVSEEKEEEAATSADEIISVGEGDWGQPGGDHEDAEIDVIGGSSPRPAPVTLTWTEEEEVDVEEEVIIEGKKDRVQFVDCHPQLGLI